MLPIGVGASLTVSFVDGGRTIGSQTNFFCIPEPSSLILVGLALLSLAGIRH